MDVCLHLPPYHPELNATEKIWTTVKNWMAARNVILSYRMLKLAEEKFALVTREEWVSVCNCVKELEKKYVENIRVGQYSRQLYHKCRHV